MLNHYIKSNKDNAQTRPRRLKNIALPPVRISALALLLWLVLCSIAGSNALASQGVWQEGQEIIVGSEIDFPPFAIGDSPSNAGGFTVELWRATAESQGLKYKIRVAPFETILKEFQDEKIDVLLNLAESPDRRKYANFTVSHVKVNGAIFIRDDYPFISKESDLKDKSVIVIKSDLAHEYAISQGLGNNLVLVESVADGIALLSSGKHDAMLVGRLTGLQTIDNLGIKNIRALNTPAGYSQKFAFATHKHDYDLLSVLNEGLAITKATGTYDQLYEKWLGVYTEPQPRWTDTVPFLITPVIILISLIGYLLYQRIVERRRAQEELLREHELLEIRVVERTQKLDRAMKDLQLEVQERKVAQVSLQKANSQIEAENTRLESILNGLAVGVYLTDKTGQAKFINPTLLRMSGEPLEKLLQNEWMNKVYIDDRYYVKKDYAEGIRLLKPFSLEFRYYAADGTIRWAMDSVRPLYINDQMAGFIGTVIDITAHYVAEDRIRSLAKILSTREQSLRNEVAAAIHDGPTQQAIVLSVNLQKVRWHHSSATLSTLESTSKELVQSLRTLIGSIHPIDLRLVPFEAAIKTLSQRLEQSLELSVRIEIKGDCDKIDQRPELRELLISATRELLTNIWKHAEQPEVMVKIRVTAKKVRLTVRDFGKGFDYSEPDALGFGLVLLREKSEWQAGSMNLYSSKGTGTLVSLLIPLVDLQQQHESFLTCHC